MAHYKEQKVIEVGILSARCLSGQRVCADLTFVGSFCVKTKRTEEIAIKH